MQDPAPRWKLDLDDPRAPTEAQWEAMTAAERAQVRSGGTQVHARGARGAGRGAQLKEALEELERLRKPG